MRMRLLSIALVATAITLPARADMGLGGIARTGSGQTTVPLRIFGPAVNGTGAASYEMSGPAMGVQDTMWATYEPNEQLLYVSDFYGKAIRVYPAFKTGNVAPIRVINPPVLSQTRANAPVFAHDELGVITTNCCIAVYPLHGNGDTVAPIRTILWGGGANPTTQLNNPGSLTYLPDTDEFAVIDYEPGTNASRIIFHARTASGYATPTRTITGNGVAGAVGIAHDRRAHLLYVLGKTTLANLDMIGRVAVFLDTASGAATPLYTIAGSLTQLNRPAGHYFVGIGHDPYERRIMVSSSTSSVPAAHRVIIFNEDAAYNSVPLRDLSGDSLGPGYMGTPFGVPSWDVIHRNGFDLPPPD
ncbi:MAG: hypothetical protein J0L88_02070 [Xanthomonadales bacterium]|nr:hypothetical protein [Xanthomonadales bacterium]